MYEGYSSSMLTSILQQPQLLFVKTIKWLEQVVPKERVFKSVDVSIEELYWCMLVAGGQVAGGHLSIVVIISRQGVTASTTSHHHLHPLCAGDQYLVRAEWIIHTLDIIRAPTYAII